MVGKYDRNHDVLSVSSVIGFDKIPEKYAFAIKMFNQCQKTGHFKNKMLETLNEIHSKLRWDSIDVGLKVTLHEYLSSRYILI